MKWPLLFLVLSGLLRVEAREYFVAPDGSDSQAGSRRAPFKTIQHAADLLNPGDICTIRAGVYREWVMPRKGGQTDSSRIVYRAAPGEKVVIKGSEQIRSWTKTPTGWTAEIPDAFFGEFNPFKQRLSGDWLHYGTNLHLGSIYLNGNRLLEKENRQAVSQNPDTFCVEPGRNATVLHANFGNQDPNRELTEIDVRECTFFPVVTNLAYITLDALEFEHASANWAAWRRRQRGAVGTNWGRCWVIQNCSIHDARCVGLVCGNEASGENEGFDLAAVGGHLVRNNHIFRCGQAGIHGFKGWAGSTFEANLIEDINIAREFGGEETGGIKVHSPIDITIRNNVLRRINARSWPGKNTDFAAIWIDWAGQGTRVTGNIVYETEAWALYLQNNHGSPIIVDHNVFFGTVATSSEGCVFAHNLFVQAPWRQLKRYADVAYWRPHTADAAGVSGVINRNDFYLNNIFVAKGAENFPISDGSRSDWNVYYDGAKPTTWGDANSFVSSENRPEITLNSSAQGVQISISGLKSIAHQARGPVIGTNVIPRFALTGQAFETPDGKPLRLDRDLRDRRRPAATLAGPFETTADRVQFRFEAGPR